MEDAEAWWANGERDGVRDRTVVMGTRRTCTGALGRGERARIHWERTRHGVDT